MPKAACPACKTEVKYPRDAEPGTQLTCPDCDEVFIPPGLKEKKKKGYDPEADEDVYRAELPIADPDADRKTRMVVGAAHAAARREHERSRPGKRAWFEGPEIWLLIFAAGSAGGLPFGLWLARNWEKMGTARMFWIMVALCFLAITALSLGMSSWAWLRKSR